MLTAVVVLFVLFFLLIIPIEAEFRFNNLSGNDKSVKLKAMFGLVSKTVYPSVKSEKHKSKESVVNDKKKKTGPGFSKLTSVLRNGKFLGKTLGTFKKLLFSLKPDLKKFHLRLGLNDPADTGILWGLIGPLSGILYGYTEKDVFIEPDFLDPSLGLNTRGSLSIVPLEILYISLCYILSPTVIKTYLFEIRGAG